MPRRRPGGGTRLGDRSQLLPGGRGLRGRSGDSGVGRGQLLAHRLQLRLSLGQLFLPALDAAGTFGITFLFGIVPAACVWRLRQDENTEVFVPGGDAVLAAMVGLSAFVIGEGALDALGLV